MDGCEWTAGNGRLGLRVNSWMWTTGNEQPGAERMSKQLEKWLGVGVDGCVDSWEWHLAEWLGVNDCELTAWSERLKMEGLE